MASKRITKKSVTEAQNRFFRERQKWGEDNLSTIRAEIAWRDLETLYNQQEESKKHLKEG